MVPKPLQVPLLDLKPQYASIESEIRAAIDRVLASQHFVLGPEVEAFEQEFADYAQCKYAIGVSSGTDALLIALMALEIGPGDEVILPSYTFFATAGAVARLGATPVFADSNPNTFNLDVSSLASLVTHRTRAIIPVHLFGQTADMEPLINFAADAGLAVIEDVAQAVGADYRNQRAGSLGTLGCFSFFPAKTLGGIGDGGMVTTNDEQLADQVRCLRTHGGGANYVHEMIGGNFRLDAIQAAVLRVKLTHLEEWIAARREKAECYKTLFAANNILADLPSCAADGCHAVHCDLQSIRGVVFPSEAARCRHTYNYFVIRVSHRDAVRAHLNANGIGNAVYYPIPLHLQTCFADLGYSPGSLPVSECAARSTLALPIYPELPESQQATAVDAIAEAVRNLSF